MCVCVWDKSALILLLPSERQCGREFNWNEMNFHWRGSHLNTQNSIVWLSALGTLSMDLILISSVMSLSRFLLKLFIDLSQWTLRLLRHPETYWDTAIKRRERWQSERDGRSFLRAPLHPFSARTVQHTQHTGLSTWTGLNAARLGIGCSRTSTDSRYTHTRKSFKYKIGNTTLLYTIIQRV